MEKEWFYCIMVQAAIGICQDASYIEMKTVKVVFMNIRKANMTDLDAIEIIYNDIHTEEEKGNQTIGWIRDIYPTRKTAEESIFRGDMFVLEEGEILGAGIINQILSEGQKSGNTKGNAI